MIRTGYTMEVGRDAGLLREYLATRYGPDYFFGQGLGYESFATFLRLVKRLARMASLTVEGVLRDLRQDTENYLATL